MQIFLYMLVGLASGIFAGMGMGGGTFLIPLLTIFLSVSQRTAQGINLLVFLPMSIIVIFIYARKKMLDYRGLYLISLPATIVSALGAFFAINLPAKILKISFGIFIIIVALVQTVLQIIFCIKKRKNA